MKKLSKGEVFVPKVDIGSTCDIVELIFQHSNEKTNKLTIELPSNMGLNYRNEDHYTNWKEKLNEYSKDYYENFATINFEIVECNGSLVINF